MCILRLFFATFLLPVLITSPLFAQEQHFFPDSLFFGAQVTVQHVDTLEGVGTAVAEIPDLHVLLMETTGDWYGSRYVLAVATSTGYDLHPIIGDETADEVHVSVTDVRGDGQLQVVLRTMWYAGHTGWEHAIHERDWTVTVWDIQARRSLLHLVTGRSMEEWTNTFAPDSTGLLPYEERALLSSEGDAECETYEASFTPKHLLLLRTDDCSFDEGGLDLVSKRGERVEYALTEGGWVLVR
ncbi:MAG TPA: hypothetical protein PK760_06190 [Flavobacteriales bacterium]|nr:hypothetical protein [Flavobacteriales bacterium]